MNLDRHGVYAIVCSANDRIYIGSSVCIRKRFNSHRKALRDGNHRNLYMQRAWNKYGEKTFEFEVLRTVRDPQNLIKWEQYWINRTENLFNIRLKAESALGVKRRQETKDKISKALSGRKLSPEHCAKISEIQTGKKFSKEHRENISAGNLLTEKRGRSKPFTEEHRLKISLGQIGRCRIFSESHKKALSVAATLRGPMSEDVKSKIGNANRGQKRVFTEAHKAAIKAAWDKRKEANV